MSVAVRARGPWEVLLLIGCLFQGRVVAGYAQSHAVDGVIVGAAVDTSGGAMPGVTVTVRQDQTGLSRETRTGTDGRYAIPALPPGTYAVEGAAPGFESARHAGVTLRAGETQVVDMRLGLAGRSEALTVGAGDGSTRPAAVDLGRGLSAANARALPSLLRNPLNAALLAPGVVGSETDEINQPRINANGAQMRNNYQIDGNTNNQRDRAGLRLVTLSPVMIGELKVTTAGFAPEFGQMTGVVVNAITPSGTNALRGRVDFGAIAPTFVARSPLVAKDAAETPTHSITAAVAIGGPIRRDRVHFFTGYEHLYRDASTGVLTIAPDNASRLGVEVPPGGWLDPKQHEHFFIGKVDAQTGAHHRVSLRALGFVNDSPLAGPGGLTALTRAVDVFVRMSSTAVQVVSAPTPRMLNEFRAQRAHRLTYRQPSSFSAPGPSVDISGIANIGGPFSGIQSADSSFRQTSWQIVDNVTSMWRGHTFKAGMDVQWIDDERTNTKRRLYTFSTLEAYLAAASGTNRFAYATYLEDAGSLDIQYQTLFASGFVQDSLSVGTRLNVLFGVRYDFFGVPASGGLTQVAASDRNNVGPRVGAAYSLDREARTVLRGYAGLLYDAPPLQLYQDAMTTGPSSRSTTTTVSAASTGAPAFPDGLASGPVIGTGPRPSIVTIAPTFESSRAWQTSVQLERAIGARGLFGIGYVSARGQNLAVLVDRNLIEVGDALADGRPIYSTVVSSATRIDPAYDHVDVVESIGRSRYHGLVLTGRQVWAERGQVNVSYTWSTAKDSAPLTNAYVQGAGQEDRASDPSDLERDFGPTPFDQPHTLVVDGVLTPVQRGSSRWSWWFGGLSAGFNLAANSGMRANVRANRDLNRDGRLNDRPLGVMRNSANVGRVANLDLKVSRLILESGERTMTMFVGVKNAFNRTNVSSVNRVIPTDANGTPLEPIPATLPATAASSTRRLELGFSFSF